MRRLLVLRPEPGAARTAARAAAQGLETVVAPIFAVRPIDWATPDPAEQEAVIFTSPNAPSLAGQGLAPLLSLPCYAVGETTADAARLAGFTDVRTGPSDAAALMQAVRQDGIRRAVHLVGRDHRDAPAPEVCISRIVVYAAVPADHLPSEAIDALAADAIVLLHSPAAAAHFRGLADRAGLARGHIDLVAISAAAADAAGTGWRSMEASSRPRDDALLELAAKLCKTGAPARSGGGRG